MYHDVSNSHGGTPKSTYVFWPLEDIQIVQQKNLGWVSNNQIMRGNNWY